MIGVGILVVVLGTPGGAHAVLDSFDHAWLVIGAFAIAGALASLAILGIRRPAPFGHTGRESVAAATRGRT